jgi:hypothetical protein
VRSADNLSGRTIIFRFENRLAQPSMERFSSNSRHNQAEFNLFWFKHPRYLQA